jgi:hypothetical protein
LLTWNNADNYFNESFPQVFERKLAPVFAALQVSFVVRNHALGNNPCYPYDACIATHLGEDLDILAWEQVRKRTPICVGVGVLWLCCHVTAAFLQQL